MSIDILHDYDAHTYNQSVLISETWIEPMFDKTMFT